MVAIACPGCQTDLTVEETNMGREVACPKCSVEFRTLEKRRVYAEPVNRQRPMSSARCCSSCGTSDRPIIKSEVSTAGWVTFAVLLTVFAPLCWIGFFMKDRYRVCAGCGHRV
jgi:DNA-directed RNA polymerase subunit RPC12/RpoP